MYATAPSASRGPAAPAPAGALGLASITGRRFGQGLTGLDDASRTFLQAALPASGVALVRERLDRCSGNAYGQMARAVLCDLDAEVDVPLLVVASAVPDLRASDLAGVTAGSVLRGTTAVFGVSDQGRLAAFLALSLAVQFAARQGYERAVVLVADQGSLPYDTDRTPLQRVDGDAVVALLLERAPAPGFGFACRTGLRSRGSAAVPAALDQVYAELTTPVCSAEVDVILGAGVGLDWEPPHVVGCRPVQVQRAGLGLPTVGPWLALAETAARLGAPTVVLDADPAIGMVSGVRLSPTAPERQR